MASVFGFLAVNYAVVLRRERSRLYILYRKLL